MSRKKRKKDDVGPNMERWLLPYSDMITLLMALFIMFYAISNVDAQKFQQIAHALGQTLGSYTSEGAPGGDIPPILLSDMNGGEDEDGEGFGEDLPQLNEIKKELEQYLQDEHLEGKVTVEMEERGLVISLQDIVLFESGSATITPVAGGIISDIGEHLKTIPNYLRVEGHTDNLPIKTAVFPSNWELSVARSTNVVQALINRCGIPPERLSSTGYGEYRPRADNDTPQNRQMNRRVDVLILREMYRKVEPD